MERKRLPKGMENFEDIVTKNYYYVDKTMLIKEILDDGAAVTLFSRLRRFGKSLNMSMLKSFFEIGADEKLFEGFSFLNDSDKLGDNNNDKEKLLNLIKNEGDLENSLLFLSAVLYKHYGRKVIISIDEYDVPLDKAYNNLYLISVFPYDICHNKLPFTFICLYVYYSKNRHILKLLYDQIVRQTGARVVWEDGG